MSNQQTLSRRSIMGATVSTAIEWFDFTCFIYLIPIISVLFFPSKNHLVSLMDSFGVFAAGYLMRPLGGIFFGHLGDRIGRKKVLISTLILMSFSLLVMAFLPTYNQIGVTAVVLLLLTRMLQGFSVGGEYTGVLVMLLEQADPKRRGFITSLGAMVSGLGVLFSSLTVAIVTLVLSRHQLYDWGWRLPFIVGVLLSIIAIIMQLRMHESPAFEQAKAHKSLTKMPVIEALKSHPREVLQVMALAGYLGVAYYMAAAFLPTYLISVMKIPHTDVMFITALSAAVYAFTAPFWGHLSDKVGRKPILISTTIALLVGAYPIFWLMSQHSITGVIIGEVLMFLFISACTAAFVTTINEAFPTHLRFSGVATGYNIGNAIFGATTPLVATLLIHLSGIKIAPSFYLMLAAVLILFVIIKMPETRGMDQGD